MESAVPLAVDLMTSAEAHELLAPRLGAERLTGAGDAAAELIGLCSRLPLALAIGAARAALQPERALASVAAELRDSASRLDSLGAGDALSDARSVFSWSYRELSGQASRAPSGSWACIPAPTSARRRRPACSGSRPPRPGESSASCPARTS